MSERRTFQDRVADFFRAHPNRWIAATSFESVGGRQGWRTRISECRRTGMHIDNRVRLVRNPDGSTYNLSEYRYVPAEEPIPQTLPLEASGSDLVYADGFRVGESGVQNTVFKAR